MEYINSPPVFAIMKFEQRFIFKWILATGVGDLLAASISVIITWLSARSTNLTTGSTILIFGTTYGVILGTAQWLVIRNRIHPTHWWMWILATIIGTIIGSAIIKSRDLSGFWSFVASGSTIGFAQYLILRRRFIHTGWWIIIYSVGWVASQAATLLVEQGIVGVPSLFFQIINAWLIIFILEFVFAAITGFTLAWIFQYPIQEETTPHQTSMAGQN
jgi:hypothetical protein